MSAQGIENVRGIVLAGTHRWGASRLDRALPRTLLPVAGSPLVCYALRWLRDGGVRNVTMCANSDSRLTLQHLGDGSTWGLDLTYYEDLTPRGPAGCARDAAEVWSAPYLVVVQGTVVPTVDLAEVLATHRQSGAGLTVVAQRVDEAGEASAYESVGIYVISREVLDAVPRTGYQDIKEILIPRLHATGVPVAMHEATTIAPRVTSTSTYLQMNAYVLDRLARDQVAMPGYELTGQTYIHHTARIDPGARVYGAVMIGPDTHIERDGVVIGPAVLGRGCRVASHAVVSGSILWDGVEIGSNSLVDRCVAMRDVEVGSGENLRSAVLDHTQRPYAVARAAHGSASPAQAQRHVDGVRSGVAGLLRRSRLRFPNPDQSTAYPEVRAAGH